MQKVLHASRVSREKISISYNGCNAKLKTRNSSSAANELREAYNIGDKTVIGYAGTIGISHGLEKLIAPFEEIALELNAVLIIIGSGALLQKLRDVVESESFESVLVLDAVPEKQLGTFFSLFDISLVSLKNIPAYDKVIPSKLFEAAAYDKPVIAGIRGEAKLIVESYNFGEVFVPEDGEDLKSSNIHV